MKKLNDFPEWKAAQEKLTALQLRRQQTEEERLGLIQQINAECGVDRLTAEASVLLNGGGVSRSSSALRDKVGDQMHQQKVLTKAIELQKAAIQDLRSRLSAAICAEVKPKYAAAVREVAQAAIKLSRLMEKERDLRMGLHDDGVAFAGALGPCVFSGPGYLDDEHSRINHFLDEAERLGFIIKEALV